MSRRGLNGSFARISSYNCRAASLSAGGVSMRRVKIWSPDE
jgi:hypothetical protein